MKIAIDVLCYSLIEDNLFELIMFWPCQVILCHELETEVFVFQISGTVLFCGKGAKKLLGGEVGGKTDRTLLAARPIYTSRPKRPVNIKLANS